jgi:glycosyltransferase involved in cell wall biosynthesis
MARWLAAHGHRVVVLAIEQANTPGFRRETTEQDGVTVHRLFYDAGEGDADRRQYDHPAVATAFREVLSEEPFDLVHVVSGYLLGVPAVQVPRAMGLAVVVTLTEFWFMCARLNLIQSTGALCSGPERDAKCSRCLLESQRRFRLPGQAMPAIAESLWGALGRLPVVKRMTAAVAARRAALRAALAAASLVVCPSEGLLDAFERSGFDTSRFVFMRQGIDKPSGDPPVLERREFGLRLGYVGQVKWHKGVDLVVDAVIGMLDEGHQVSLDVWGSDTEPEYAQALMARTADRPAIRWNGGFTGDRVWAVLAGVDALVVPSRWYENSPNVILEAYEKKVPVVATDLGGMSELVEDGRTGLVFGLDDAADLRRQLTRLVVEPGLLASLSRQAPAVKSIDDEMEDLARAYVALESATAAPDRRPRLDDWRRSHRRPRAS